MPIINRTFLRRSVRIVCLLLALAAALALAACRGTGDPSGSDATAAPGQPFPNDKQKQSILAIAEAFYESGEVWDGENVLGMSRIESFVYWLYNGELTAEGSEFASVPAEQSDKRLGDYFGVEPVLRTGRRTGVDQDFYYANGNYFVRVKPSPVTESEIASLEQKEDGVYTAKLLLTEEGGAYAELIMNFTPNDDGESVRVLSVVRFEGR